MEMNTGGEGGYTPDEVATAVTALLTVAAPQCENGWRYDGRIAEAAARLQRLSDPAALQRCSVVAHAYATLVAALYERCSDPTTLKAAAKRIEARWSGLPGLPDLD